MNNESVAATYSFVEYLLIIKDVSTRTKPAINNTIPPDITIVIVVL
jgi:hypothetical protein